MALSNPIAIAFVISDAKIVTIKLSPIIKAKNCKNIIELNCILYFDDV